MCPVVPVDQAVLFLGMARGEILALFDVSLLSSALDLEGPGSQVVVLSSACGSRYVRPWHGLE